MFKTTATALLALSLLSTLHAGTPVAQPPVSAEPSQPQTLADSLWSHAVLFEDKENPWVQKLRILARYHSNYAWVDDDITGLSANDWESRRVRFGYNVEFLNQFEFRNEWNALGFDDEDFDPRISNIDTLFLSWKPSTAFILTAGKHKSPITQEFRWSSNEMETIERTIATQSFISIERHWGISARGDIGRWSYITGLWAGSFAGDYNISYHADGPKFFLASLSYDLGGKDQSWQKALLNLQYAHTDDPSNIAPKFDHLVSLNFEGKHGPWGIATDHLLGWGQRQAYGMYFQPSYFLTKKVQLVTRYSMGEGDADTFRQRLRYEDLVSSGAGDSYQSFYTGVNYYAYGHKLKLMAGAEYVNLKDSARKGGAFDGWTALAGLVFWF